MNEWSTHLDLEEQEQLDQLKALLEAVRQPDHLGAHHCGLAGVLCRWNRLWNWWQREQSAKAAAMFDEFDQGRDSRQMRTNKAGRVLTT